MAAQKGEKIFAKFPAGFVVHEMVAQDSGGFVEIPIPGPSGNEVLYQNCNRRVDSDETSVAPPVNRIEMRINL